VNIDFHVLFTPAYADLCSNVKILGFYNAPMLSTWFEYPELLLLFLIVCIWGTR
jgi:hypothetical protein